MGGHTTMSDEHGSDGRDERFENSPDYNHLEELAQTAQDARDDAVDVIGGHDNITDSIRESLEEAEDTIDDAQDTDDADRLVEAEPYVDDAQKAIRHLEDNVDFEANPDAVDAVNTLDNAVEDLEDALDGAGEGQLVVHVSEKSFVPGEYVIEPSEILEEAGFDQAEYLLYHGPDVDEEESHIEKGTDVDLREYNVFTAIPDETGYGGATADDRDSSDTENVPSVIEGDVEDLLEDYDVDVDTETDPQHTRVIIRDYSVPVDAYNQDETDVLIRVPENYPEAPPDWVYVDEEFALANGSTLKNEKPQSQADRNDDVIEGWTNLSWHISSINGVQWTPYRNDLRWYLETIVQGRLRTGE